jgi:hypothetical protein
VSGEKCETCRFWAKLSEGDEEWDRRECRRRSPLLTEALVLGRQDEDYDSHDAMTRVWPVTHPDDFCGEWQPKRPEAA